MSENTNVVRFVDYGNFEEVLKADCLPMNTPQPYAAPASRPVPPQNTPQYKATAPHQMSGPAASGPTHQGNKYREQRVYVPPPAQRK